MESPGKEDQAAPICPIQADAYGEAYAQLNNYTAPDLDEIKRRVVAEHCPNIIISETNADTIDGLFDALTIGHFDLNQIH